MTEFGLDNSGTVEELRKRLSTFVQEEVETENHRDRATDLALKHTRSTSAGNAPTPKRPERSAPIIMDRVRKWGVKYDGGKDPLGFIERVEELADGYEIERDALPRALPELFKDRALVWLRNNHGHWRDWETCKRDFLKFFLNSRYFERLDDEIRQRVQRPREAFKDYVLALQGLMRHSDYTEAQKLRRIYKNCRSEHQLYIKQTEFNTLGELVSLAEDYENIVAEKESQRALPRAITPRRSEERNYTIREEQRRERYTMPARRRDGGDYAPPTGQQHDAAKTDISPTNVGTISSNSVGRAVGGTFEHQTVAADNKETVKDPIRDEEWGLQ
ncbi:PREDICTED: uncharacterized protein LOC108364630 [Rhagoletis zephyria]|uniref:uncharacterized protein LOC108364630 n=1 Tax=Rhagoletis zephyria TaxID=28612 RepID=UPI0008114531|nr:PREDICTED: uncharacterized protein LOC108364630 [Rhagoletis zephyria]